LPIETSKIEVVSAEEVRALEGGEDGGGDFGKGEVLGGAAGALFPVEKELAIAISQAGRRIDVEDLEGAIDPVGGTFELGVGADWGLVDDKVRSCAGSGIEDGVFRAELFVNEGRKVAELGEYLGHGMGIGDGGLGFDPDLVSGGFAGVGGFVDALVGEGVNAAVLAQAQDLAFGAQVPGGCVVEGVVLECARGFEMEAKLGQTGVERLRIGDATLEFDLGGLHGVSIRLESAGGGARIKGCPVEKRNE
jgi:hypothetical protein